MNLQAEAIIKSESLKIDFNNRSVHQFSPPGKYVWP
jgi:hypothetical protein